MTKYIATDEQLANAPIWVTEMYKEQLGFDISSRYASNFKAVSTFRRAELDVDVDQLELLEQLFDNCNTIYRKALTHFIGHECYKVKDIATYSIECFRDVSVGINIKKGIASSVQREIMRSKGDSKLTILGSDERIPYVRLKSVSIRDEFVTVPNVGLLEHNDLDMIGADKLYVISENGTYYIAGMFYDDIGDTKSLPEIHTRHNGSGVWDRIKITFTSIVSFDFLGTSGTQR